MKVSTQREELFAQLQSVSRVASTRSTIQALSGVQLLAGSSGCELRATDMDVSLRVPLEAEVVREGVVAGLLDLLDQCFVGLDQEFLSAGFIIQAARIACPDVGLIAVHFVFRLLHPHAAGGGLPALPGARVRLNRVAAGHCVRGNRAQGGGVGVSG